MRNQNDHEIFARYEAILNHAGYAMIATTVEGVITVFNPAAEAMLGYRAEELVGKCTPAVFHDMEEINARAKKFSQELNKPIKPGFDVFIAKTKHNLSNQQEWTYVHKDGHRFIVELTITALYDHDKKVSGYLGIASDISVLRHTEQELQMTRAELATAIEVSQLGVWTWEIETNELHWNDRMYAMYEQPLSLRQKGISYEHWRMRLHPNDAERAENALKNAVAGKAEYNLVFRIVLPNKSIRYIQGAAKVERNSLGNAVWVTGMNLDVTLQYEYQNLLKKNAEFLYGQSRIDGLTGIANRRLFDERIDIEFKCAKRSGKPLALLMIDIDFFKQYNDTHSHISGDECLRKIATSFKNTLKRPADLIARYGGEEFVCLLPETDINGALNIANKLRKNILALHIENTASSVKPIITISIGIAVYPNTQCTSPKNLIEQADQNLYDAKKHGRNRCSISS